MNTPDPVSSLLTLWSYIRNTVYGWLIMIAVILCLLIIFRCFSSTASLAENELRKLIPYLSRTAGKKRMPSRARLRDIHASFVRIGRFVQAYLYDNPSDASASEAMGFIASAEKASAALMSDKLISNHAAAQKVLRNILASSTRAEELLRKG